MRFYVITIIMQRLIFATNNRHKLDELRCIVAGRVNVLGLSDIGCFDDIPEDADTLAGNALAKARWVAQHYGTPCFADDTGLEVDALGGAPGVHSARYAPGSGHDAAANTALLLKNMEQVPVPLRTAHFTTVIAFIDTDGNEHLFTGMVNGSILTAPQGDGGFGYDPVFMPDGWQVSFAQVSQQQKTAVSHRGRAVKAFLEFYFKNYQ